MPIRRTSGCASTTFPAASPRRRSSSAPGATLAETVQNGIAAELEADVLERFLRYVRIDTQSDPESKTYPSTAKQRDLGELLARELEELGLDDVSIDGHGYGLEAPFGPSGR